MIKKTFITVALSILWSTAAIGKELVFIVNEANPQKSITKEDIKRIYLGRKKTWDNGRRIKAATLPYGSHELNLLTEVFLAKTVRDFAFYWSRKIFSGTGVAPRSFEKPKDVISYVAREPTAVGFIAQTPKDLTKVRVLSTE